MERDFTHTLNEWLESEIRVPLIIKGARQVGKSWLIETFSKNFEHFIMINFD